jgi:hypothetical protein
LSFRPGQSSYGICQYAGFRPARSRSLFAGILDLFWNQLMRIQPETFIADGRDCLTLVSINEKLIAHAHALLTAWDRASIQAAE